MSDASAAVLQLDVSVVTSSPEPGALVDHLSSTLVAGVRITGAGARPPSDDVVWLQSAESDHRRHAIEAAARGAIVVTADARLLDAPTVSVPVGRGRFPAVAPELTSLQELLAALLGAVDEADLPLLLGRGETSAAALSGADVLVEGDGGVWSARVRVGRGEILWLGVLPEEDGAGYRVESHTPLRAAAWQLLVDEALAYAFRRRHGLSVRKLFGPYGAPMLAWQAHVEEVGGLGNRSMERFTTRLANSRQVPSFSLIRRTYRWGRRVPGLVYLPCAADVPDGVRAQPEGPAFFSGHWITLADGAELGFAAPDRYVDFHTPIPKMARVYPAPGPCGTLALGTPEGRIELFAPGFRDGRVVLTRLGPVLLGDGSALCVPGASPTFGTAASSDLLVVGDDRGDLRVYRDTGAGWSETARHSVGTRVAPRLVDWTGSGTPDLLLGTEDGAVELLEDVERLGLARRTKLFDTGCARLAPWPLLAGGRRRILYGDLRGRLAIWEDGVTTALPSRDSTMAGSTDVYLQQDAVPVLMEIDGRTVLIAGASVVGAGARSVDDPSQPVAAVLRDTLARLRASHTPCNAHLFLLQGASPLEVSAELSRHRACFAALGLPWDGMGANGHGWWIPRGETALAFLLQRTSGLCFNFGWQSPGTRGAPDIDVKYALAFPFLLRVEGAPADFVLHAPALPDRYPRALEVMATAGLPLTFFVHPEYRDEGAAVVELDRWIGAVDDLRRRHEGVFVTENQMARSIAVTLTGDVRVLREDGGAVRLEADVSGVPSWAMDFARTLSVAVEWAGPAPADFTSDGIHSVRGRRFVASVGRHTTVLPGDTPTPAWRVTRANAPIQVGTDGVDVLAPGFQEIHIAGAAVDVEWPGAHLRETAAGVVVTRFGEPGRARVRTNPEAALRATSVSWSPHDSTQDRWIIQQVFRGRTTPGYFVETGAADGVSTSASLALERSFGWSGIAVEPNFLFFDQLRRNRRCHVANVAVAERSGTVEFIQASWFGRIQEHFQEGRPGRDHLQDPYLKVDLDGTPASVVPMTALSLEDLLTSYRAPEQVDFVAIDAEFSEWFILRVFPFHRFDVLALCTRSKYFHASAIVDSPHAEDIRRLLGDLGYFYDRERSRHVQYDFFVHPRLITPPLPDPALGRRRTLLPRIWRRLLRETRPLRVRMMAGLAGARGITERHPPVERPRTDTAR